MKYVRAALLAGLFLLLVRKGILPGWRSVHSDFANYYVAADLALRGENLSQIYDNAWFREQLEARELKTPGKFSPHPPLAAWVMTPVAWLEPLTAQRAFVVVNVAFLAAGIAALRAITKSTITGAALLVAGSGVSLYNNFAYGQLYWITTSCLLISLVLYERNKPAAAGVIIGFFSALKYLPVLWIVGYFLHGLLSEGTERRKSRVLTMAAVITVGALGLSQLMAFGSGVMSGYLSTFVSHVQSELDGQNMYSYHFQSWDSLLRNLFVHDPVWNPSPFLNWPEGKAVIKLTVVAGVAALMAGEMWKYRNAGAVERRAVFLSVPIAAAMAVLPATASYHSILLLPPVAVLAGSGLLQRHWEYALMAAYCAIGFIPYGPAYESGDRLGVLFAFPRLWLTVAFYGIVIAGVRRRANGKRPPPVLVPGRLPIQPDD